MANMNAEDAKRLFRKMANTTSYAMEFGERPKAVEDYKILQHKKLDELYLSQILKPSVKNILQKWLNLNADDSEFIGRVYFTLREMNTTVSNQMAVVPEAPHKFRSEAKMNTAVPPRFDLIVKNLQIANNEKKFREKSMSHLDKTNLFKSRLITEKPQERDLSNVNIRN